METSRPLRYVSLTLILLAGCSGAPSPVAPSTETAQAPLGFEQPVLEGTLRIDPAALTAVVVETRQAAVGDSLYFADVNRYLSATSFVPEAITLGTDTLELAITIGHPFPIPNPDVDSTLLNRADLGFAGRLVFLTDLPSGTAPADATFFEGDVICDTATIQNPDGYLTPGAAIPTPGLAANTFPYFAVVDESGEGNRVGVSNTTTGTGNYAEAMGGWQRFNMGMAGEMNWTGYGILHMGQRATRTITFDRATLGTEPIDIAFRLLAKYVDPKGGADKTERHANRLPPDIKDVSRFLYREPFGALDCERIAILDLGEGLLPNDDNSSAEVVLQVRDWDARALPTTETDLADESDPTKVPIGTEGLPTVELDLPAVLAAPLTIAVLNNDSPWGGDVGQDSGGADDELTFVGTITNEMGTFGGQSTGAILGLIRATDPEAAIDRSSYETILDNTLTAPLPAGTLQPVVYQVVRGILGDAGVESCPVAPLTAPNKTAAPSFVASHTVSGADPYISFGPLDMGSWKTPTYQGIIFQAYHDGSPPEEAKVSDLYSVNTTTGALTQLTDLADAFDGLQVTGLDTDTTNRILFTQLDGATLTSDQETLYGFARPGISYFDYTGSLLTAAPQALDTGTAGIVAFTVDAAGDLFAVDTTHTVRQYVRGPSGYTEHLATARSLRQVLGLPNENFWVCGIAQDYHNEAMFVLIKARDESQNGQVYRIECDWTVRATIAGNTNPLVLQIYERGGTLKIDNYASNGTVLDGAQDTQILIGGFSDPLDLYIINSELLLTASLFSEHGAVEFQPEYCGTRAIARFEVSGAEQLDAYTLPVGWQ